MKDLNTKLSSVSYYKELFTKAYGSEEITSDTQEELTENLKNSIQRSHSNFFDIEI